MSGFKNLGAKPKDVKKKKPWNILPPSKKHQHQNYTHPEELTDNNYLNSIKKEINRLEEVNKKYESDYFHERKMLLFSVYEQQYLLDTKTNYWKNQQKLISAMNTENSNIMATINMYNNRIKVNNEHILSLDEGAKTMEIYSRKLREDITAIINKIDVLDNNRKEAVKHNSELRIKYLNLLKVNIEKERSGENGQITHPQGCKQILDLVKELEICFICYHTMTPKVFSCRQSHSICSKCYEKIGDKCPFCSTTGPFSRNRVVENLIKVTNESKAASNTKVDQDSEQGATKL